MLVYFDSKWQLLLRITKWYFFPHVITKTEKLVLTRVTFAKKSN